MWILSRGKVVEWDKVGQPLRMVGTHTDITARKRAEDQLFEEKERALVTLESIADAVITTDAQGVIEYLNPVAERLTGWPAEAARGQPLSVVFHLLDERSREQASDPVTRCLAENRTIAPIDHHILVNTSRQKGAGSIAVLPAEDKCRALEIDEMDLVSNKLDVRELRQRIQEPECELRLAAIRQFRDTVERFTDAPSQVRAVDGTTAGLCSVGIAFPASSPSGAAGFLE